jgi:glutaminyl-peptide cyclotransferase
VLVRSIWSSRTLAGALGAGLLALGAGLLALATSACANKTPAQTAAALKIPEDLVPQVVQSFPHDRQAFTQGLLLFEGKLYESTGLQGRSSLRRVDPESGVVEARVDLPPELFAEGLARVGSQLFQITWRDGRALVWELGGFKKVREHSYPGEGWGLCHDGRRLVMSDGSDRLTFRDAGTFARTGDVAVTRAGEPVKHLNELECVGDVVYANVWMDDHIARIDAKTGEVTGWIDAAGLLGRDERSGADVLNGIAYVPERGTFFITGKLWPRLFEVRFVPRSAATGERHP